MVTGTQTSRAAVNGQVFGALYAAEGSDADTLMAVARDFSPRVSRESPREVILDLDGLSRLFGDRRTIAEELRRTAADRGLRVRVAIAGSMTAARLLVHQRPGLTVIDRGGDVAAVAPLPVEALLALRSHEGHRDDTLEEMVRTLRRWGIASLAAFSVLPPDDVAARLGQNGVRWQRVARGEDLSPLVPAVPDERFEQALDLEWPIEGLEPLSFVLGRLLEPLSQHLERRDRGAAVLHVCLHLVTREVHARSLQLPVPMREPKALRTLLLLDLESHPPGAAIDRVVVAVDPTPGRIVQYSLLARPLPTPEQLSTLMARLQALMGESRVGAPSVVDSWQPGACAMKPFAPVESSASPEPRPASRDPRIPGVALRRFRMPVVVRVQEDHGRPARVLVDRRGITGGRVEACAGPWRTSGGWWTERPPAGTGHTSTGMTGMKGVRHAGPEGPEMRTGTGWDRDEWDVMLADGVTYRLFRERESGKWFLDGMVD